MKPALIVIASILWSLVFIDVFFLSWDQIKKIAIDCTDKGMAYETKYFMHKRFVYDVECKLNPPTNLRGMVCRMEGGVEICKPLE